MRKCYKISALLVVLLLLTACQKNTDALTPEITSVPSVTDAPTATTAPQLTDASVTTTAPTVSDAPTATTAPAVSDTPAATTAPAVSDAPTTTTAPAVSDTPTATSTPSVTDTPAAQASTFRIESDTADGYVWDPVSRTCTILAAGTYDCYGDLPEGQLIVSADKDAKIVINLNGCTITNSTVSPISVLQADEVDISAKKGTENRIYDLRTGVPSEEDPDTGKAAIYAECDLTIKGNGVLEIISTYNNGIHTKDDLDIKNVTLSVQAVNNAIKGNDSVTIESGTITAISSGGDAIKTTSTDANKKGEQRGVVEISGGNVTLYAACDGIDSASDVRISGDAVLQIYTDTYSPYSGDVMISSSSTLYLRMDASLYNAGYRYSAWFYNEDGSGQWADLSFHQKVTASTGPGNRGGNRFGAMWGTTYYYYAVTMPSGFSNVLFYAYSADQPQGQSEQYTAVSNSDTTIPSSRDTYVITSAANSVLRTSGWTSYQSSMGNTGLDYSCKGIKADNTILITGGTIDITAKDDGIHANFDTVMEATGQNGLGNIVISGGTITLSSDDDGIHADQDLTISGGSIRILTSYEGLEANRIYLSDGSVTLYAKDDGVNANSKGAYAAYIEISGGLLDATVPSGDTDTMDSNGTILISGGTVLLKNGQMAGSSMTGGTIDTDRGITVTGGTVIAIGCIGDRISNSLYNTSITWESGNYSLQDSHGNELLPFTLTSSYRACMFYSDRFISGETYTIYKDGTAFVNFTR